LRRDFCISATTDSPSHDVHRLGRSEFESLLQHPIRSVEQRLAGPRISQDLQ
jgi:hypothetical protein